MSHDKKKPSSLTYGTYLKVPELLSLQHMLSKPVAHDELLFIVIHQVYELWFKVVLFELDSLVENLGRRDLISSLRNLDRVSQVFNVLVQQIDILETMSPVEFNQFRSHINPASGFQSIQFRELELIAGADPANYSRYTEYEPEWAGRLEEWKKKKNLRVAFSELLSREGLVANGGTLVDGVLAIYNAVEKHATLHTLCERIIGFDEVILLWRFRHVQMVERMIGMKPGTGGSLGVPYLKSTLTKKFFPELWEARTKMGSVDFKY